MAKEGLKGADHKKQLNRLKRIEGQVRGIGSMVEEGRYCIDIIHQIKAIKSALSSVEQNVIERHLDHCVEVAIKSKSKGESDRMLVEIKDLLKKVNK